MYKIFHNYRLVVENTLGFVEFFLYLINEMRYTVGVRPKHGEFGQPLCSIGLCVFQICGFVEHYDL